MRSKSLILFIGLTLAVLGLVARPTHAADIRTGERVVIADDEVIDDDLIVSAQFIEVNGTVTGDLVATGTIIIINGSVGGSAIVAAQSVEVRGAIDGSLYGTAYSLLLGEGAAVNRNVLFGGFSAATQAGSEVGRDLHVAGYQMLHDGRIGGDLNVSTVALQLNGAVGGDVAGEVNAAGSAALPQIPLPNMPATTQLPSGLVVGPAAQTVADLPRDQPHAPTAGRRFRSSTLAERPAGTVIGLLLVAVRHCPVAALPARPRGALQRRPLPASAGPAHLHSALPGRASSPPHPHRRLTLLFAMVTFGN
jgi:cytoskeletal protein CcmA (bactofilin family)